MREVTADYTEILETDSVEDTTLVAFASTCPYCGANNYDTIRIEGFTPFTVPTTGDCGHEYKVICLIQKTVERIFNAFRVRIVPPKLYSSLGVLLFPIMRPPYPAQTSHNLDRKPLGQNS